MTLKEIQSTFKGEKSVGDTLAKVGGLAVNIGTDLVVGGLLTAFVDKGKGIKRILGAVGVFIFAMKCGEEAENYFYKVVEDTKEAISSAKKQVKEVVEEVEADSAPAEA